MLILFQVEGEGVLSFSRSSSNLDEASSASERKIERSFPLFLYHF
jgi:hypothetical protein